MEKDVSKNLLEKVEVLNSLLQKQVDIRNALDTRANIFIGFDSALIVFIITNYQDNIAKNTAFTVALIAAVLSLFCAILALKPLKFIRKKGQKETIFYHDYINSKTYEEYKSEMDQTIEDPQKIYDAYYTETYNITKYSNIPKKFYAHLSIRVLIYGILLSILVYALTITGII